MMVQEKLSTLTLLSIENKLREELNLGDMINLQK